MRCEKFPGGFLIRLERGEEITETLAAFLLENNIKGGTVTGLGGIVDAELGFYDLPSKTYIHQIIPGNLELIQYWGNITLVDGTPFIHAHATVAGPDYIAKAGHFFSAKIIITGEFVIRPEEWDVSRALDDITGLKLMNF